MHYILHHAQLSLTQLRPLELLLAWKVVQAHQLDACGTIVSGCPKGICGSSVIGTPARAYISPAWRCQHPTCHELLSANATIAVPVLPRCALGHGKGQSAEVAQMTRTERSTKSTSFPIGADLAKVWRPNRGDGQPLASCSIAWWAMCHQARAHGSSRPVQQGEEVGGCPGPVLARVAARLLDRP